MFARLSRIRISSASCAASAASSFSNESRMLVCAARALFKLAISVSYLAFIPSIATDLSFSY